MTKISQDYKIDRRTLEKYLIRYEYCTKEEISTLLALKKMKPYDSGSCAEDHLFDLLVVAFGETNVKRQFRLKPYFYDFLLFDKLIIEYDGYYWHNEMPFNDEAKNLLASESGYDLYRVKEDIKRKVNFVEEINIIKEKIKIKKWS